MNSIMAIGAHCDDVEFLCGGTLLKYHHRGYDVVYVEATNNMSGGWSRATTGAGAVSAPVPPEGDYKYREDVRTDRIVYTVPWFIEQPQRKKEAENSARCFFGTEVIHLDYPQSGYLDENLNLVKVAYGVPVPACVTPGEPSIVTACADEREVLRVRDLILDRNPEVIFTHPVQDNNPEHFGTCTLVKKAFRAALREGFDGSLLFSNPPNSYLYGYSYDTWDAFVDTTGCLTEKMKTLAAHACQLPYPERLDLPDTMYGEIMGVGTAEAFHTAYLSPTRAGGLSDELRNSYAYCRKNFQKLFFSPENERKIRGYFEEAFQNNRML